jgi:hypothetical protein
MPDVFSCPVFPWMENPILAGFLQSVDRPVAYESASLMWIAVLTHTD